MPGAALPHAHGGSPEGLRSVVVGPGRAHAIQKFSLYALFSFIRQVSIRYVLRLGLKAVYVSPP